MALTTGQIAQMTAGDLRGPDDIRVDALETLDHAAPNQLTFIGDRKYVDAWAECPASAALVAQGLDVSCSDGRALIVVEDADLAVAVVLEAMAQDPIMPEPGVHPAAVVAESARIADDSRIGPNCFIGPDVAIGSGCVIHSNVSIFDGARIGQDCWIWSSSVVRERCVIGDRCIIHPNVTIGSDGFGYRPAPDGQSLVKLAHVGTVEIGNDVEIGSGTCIDRGKFSATVIGNGTKIDNLVQIAHNCRIGQCVVIAGQCGIAGSIEIGDGAVLGGMVGIKDHLKIGAGATLAACSQVMNDVPPGETWAGSPAQELHVAARELVALRKLPDMIKQFKRRK